MNEQAPPYVIRRLNSLMRQITDIENTKKIPQFDRVEVIWNAYAELHQQIAENMETDEFFPEYREHKAGHSEILLELIKTRIREIADNLSIDIEIDKANISPNTVINQIQNVTQTNVQSLSNLIDIVNSLSIPKSDKEKITSLVKEFEEEAKNTKQPKKLRGILFKVAELSIDAACFLLKHANEIGVLKNLLLPS